MTTNEKILLANDAAMRERKNVTPTTTKDMLELRHKYPYRGFVTCKAGGVEFALFCNNDELTALHFFWLKDYEYEPCSLNVWSNLSKRSAKIADIGGHVGVYSIVAALSNPSAEIIAFEPIDYIYARLLLNAFTNGVKNIDARALGISDNAGWTEINLRFGPQTLSSGSSIEMRHNLPSTASKKPIFITTIDEQFRDAAVDLMKVDIEGHEIAALRGGAHVIERDKPSVLCEVLPSEVKEGEVFTWFAERNYECYSIHEETNTVDPFEWRGELPAGVLNYLFLNRSRDIALSSIV
ncbi:FkbM family methyltransferase [Hyphococcus luteus]|uniref:Methyltransferase FkbM domain-containing protein n=1 Tax=Hyphococcus luteus TaxID=2058213 RepID=A0A2S7K7Q5_9PROT|nr:FkbM family methyltransferase [Marinicaulis flavus]PQA88544.1 hypothetical protein CW354_09690 [Marinicaulis flavus]